MDVDKVCGFLTTWEVTIIQSLLKRSQRTEKVAFSFLHDDGVAGVWSCSVVVSVDLAKCERARVASGMCSTGREESIKNSSGSQPCGF